MPASDGGTDRRATRGDDTRRRKGDMFLTATNLFFYLRDIGLCTAQDVVEGQFSVAETGRRNRNFIVTRREGESLFVKQIPLRHPDLMRGLLREAVCASAAAEERFAGSLFEAMPPLLHYDLTCHAVVHAFIDGSENLNQHIARVGPVGAALASKLGGMLGRCHAETAKSGSLADMGSVLSGDPPWILSILQRPDAVMPGISSTRRQLVDALAGHPALTATLDMSRADWRRICLMHGDIKNDNVLRRDRGGQAELYLIDWELADLGDPAWDVACSLVSFLQPWLLSARMAGRPATLDGAPASVAAAARAFWSSYREVTSHLLTWDVVEAARLARLIAARFALLGFELLPDGAAPPLHLAQVVSLALHFAVDPLNALDGVFALTPPTNGVARLAARPTWRAVP